MVERAERRAERVRGPRQALGQTFDVGDIPEDMREQAEEYREALVEAAVSLDDEAMEAYLEGTVRPPIPPP
jgi:translation elongation factor EF-G